MKAFALTAALALAASAQAEGWKGVGELGLAITGGNTDTQNINGRLGLTNESDAWKHEFVLGFLRAENEDVRTANRYDLGWTSGYKLSDTSYVFGSLRYDNDDFGPFEDQTVAALGYGFYAIKSEPTNLLFEVGAGYKRSTPQARLVAVTPATTPATFRLQRFDSDGEAIFRGKIDFNHKLTDTTLVFNTFLAEVGSDNKYYQNDLGIAVKISDAFAIKSGLQFRHNSDVAPGIKKTDRLFTTNLVYSF
jgi:putative salt-induced outer membrane protein